MKIVLTKKEKELLIQALSHFSDSLFQSANRFANPDNIDNQRQGANECLELIEKIKEGM